MPGVVAKGGCQGKIIRKHMKTRHVSRSNHARGCCQGLLPGVVARGCCIFFGCPVQFLLTPILFRTEKALGDDSFRVPEKYCVHINVRSCFRGDRGISGFGPVPVGDSLLVFFGGRTPGSGPNHGISTAACCPARCTKDVLERS